MYAEHNALAATILSGLLANQNTQHSRLSDDDLVERAWQLALEVMRRSARAYPTTQTLGDVGSMVRHLREKRHLQQADLAGHIGISCSHLSRIESGALVPSRRTVERLAAGLGVEVGLITGVSEDA